MCKTRLTSLRDYCIIKLLRAFTHVVKALIFLLLTESSGCIQCLLLKSISHELPKRNGCHDLKDWPEGQYADQQLCFIILVILRWVRLPVLKWHRLPGRKSKRAWMTFTSTFSETNDLRAAASCCSSLHYLQSFIWRMTHERRNIYL